MSLLNDFMHGHNVEFESGHAADHGLRHLRENADTAKTLFEHAKRTGSVSFQDAHGRNYVIERNGQDGFKVIGK